MRLEEAEEAARDKQSWAASIVVNCVQLLTLAGPSRPRVGSELQELGLLRDSAMYIKNGRVAAIGSYGELRSLLSPDVGVIDAGGCAVLPGFIDAHTHLVFGGNRIKDFEQRVAGRTYQEIAASGGGIASTLEDTRKGSEEELLRAAQCEDYRELAYFLAAPARPRVFIDGREVA